MLVFLSLLPRVPLALLSHPKSPFCHAGYNGWDHIGQFQKISLPYHGKLPYFIPPPPPQPDLWNFQNALSPHALVISKLSTSPSVRIFHFFLQTLRNNQQSSQIYSLALILHPIISNDSTSVQWSWLQPESLQVIITPEILKI